MNAPVRKRQSTRFCGRSYMAFLFMPELPLENWLADLDSGLERSPGFFVGRPVVLDLSALQINSAEIAKLIASLQERDIRIMGLEGVDPAMTGPDLPPLLRGGRASEYHRNAAAPSTEAHAQVGAGVRAYPRGSGRQTADQLARTARPGSFWSIHSIRRRRCHGPRIGRFGRRNRRRRIDPHLWHIARSGDGRRRR